MTRAWSDRAFARVVALFPREFRDRFGEDMRDVFSDQLAAARTRGALAIAGLWVRTVPRIARAILLEHLDARHELRRRARLHSPFSTGNDGMLTTLLTDLRFAGRMLRKTPVFSAVAVVVIALGTGAVSTIYSAANAIVLRALPGTTNGDRLVGLRRTEPNSDAGVSASIEYIDHLRDRSRALENVGGWSRMPLTLAFGGERGGHALHGNIVTGNYFDLLGVRPALGRFFRAEEDSTPLAHPVVVISHSFWMARLGGDPRVLERPVLVNGHPYTVIGVAPEGFRGVFTPLRVDAWVPLAMHSQVRPTRELREHTPWLWAIGRLAIGVSTESARRELVALTADFAATSGEPARFAANSSVSITPLTGLPEDARGMFIGFIGVLFAAATLVLVIASVNVASMLSARALARRREMALRTALGAARGRLVRQLLTESILLFTLGAIAGTGLAWLATSALERLPIPSTDGLMLEISPDPNVLVFALLVALATGITFGLAPALQGTERNITTQLRGESSGSTGGRRRNRFGSTLIVAQLALSLVLLVVAGLFGRALVAGATVETGFESDGVMVAYFNTESWGYDSTKARAFHAALLARAAAIPGVRVAAYTEHIPLVFNDLRTTALVPSRSGAIDSVRVAYANVDAGYFDALQIPLLRGRGILASDDETAGRVAVINEQFAERNWPGEDPVGRTFTRLGLPVTVVGVARNARYVSLTGPTPAFAYFPMRQAWQHHHILLLRTEGAGAQTAAGLQGIVSALDPAAPRPMLRPLSDETSLALLPQRVAAIVTAALGALGLLLATVGLYGVISYSTGRRSREIGIRMAVGARRKDVLAMVLREGMWLAGAGIAVGLLLAAGATRLIESHLFGVNPFDAVAFLGTSALLVAVALLACFVPARRAASADPMVVLRGE